MRTTPFLPFVYLSSIGQSSSFPGLRSNPVAVPEPNPQTNVLSDSGKQVIFVQQSNLDGREMLEKPAGSMVVEPVEVVDRTRPQREQDRRKAIFAVSLAVLSGVMDVICFQRFGCFAHLMTGNTFKCVTAATESRWRETAFLAAMVASYTAGASGYRLVDIVTEKLRQTKRHKKFILPSAFSLLSVILLPVFGLSDVLCRIWHLPTSILAFSWAFGSGMVNASTLNSMGIVTNAVTGHWNKVGVAFADQALLGEQNGALSMSRNVITATVLSICATNLTVKALVDKARLTSLLPPVGLVIGLVYFYLFRWYGQSEESAV